MSIFIIFNISFQFNSQFDLQVPFSILGKESSDSFFEKNSFGHSIQVNKRLENLEIIHQI